MTRCAKRRPSPCGQTDANDPHVWSGRALQEVSSSWRSAVSHQCIRSLIGAVLLRANMDISARAISLTDRPQRGHVGHQCSHAPGRPILHLFSFSRRPRRVRVLITSSIASWFCTGGRSFVPTCGCRGAPRAGTVKVGRRACLASRASVARPRLDGPEHGARIKRVGTLFHWS
jgi:hypothetical protein